MSLVGRSNDRWLSLAWGVLAASLAFAGWLLGSVLRIPLASPGGTPARTADPVPFPDTDGADWSVFGKPSAPAAARRESLSEILRLAGTFAVHGKAGRTRRAILDDLRSGKQCIVGEGDKVGPMTVKTILADRVRILTEAGVLEELRMLLGEPRTPGHRPGPNRSGARRFGIRRVGERRWAFDREAVLDYYQELRDEPARLVRVFDSLAPVYDTGQKITGYRVDIQGEAELFQAAGLEQGDLVRRANSIDMTGRARAEYLINEFLQNRANIFILDIERAGKPVQLRYEIR